MKIDDSLSRVAFLYPKELCSSPEKKRSTPLLQWGHVHRVLAKLVTVEFAALRFVMDGITWGSCACYCACWNRCKIAQAFMTGGNPPEIDNVAEISRQMSLQCNLHL